MTRRRVLTFFVWGLAACRRPATPAEVSSWLRATGGVLQSWQDGSISAAAADSNLEATEKMIADLPPGSLPAEFTPKIEQASRVLAEARRAVSAGDRRAAKDAGFQLRILAAQLAPPP